MGTTMAVDAARCGAHCARMVYTEPVNNALNLITGVDLAVTHVAVRSPRRGVGGDVAAWKDHHSRRLDRSRGEHAGGVGT